MAGGVYGLRQDATIMANSTITTFRETAKVEAFEHYPNITIWNYINVWRQLQNSGSSIILLQSSIYSQRTIAKTRVD